MGRAGEKVESFEFYAGIMESVRAGAQRPFPRDKVFTSRNLCAGAVFFYEGAARDFNFTAVYAGRTEAEAQSVLAKAGPTT